MLWLAPVTLVLGGGASINYPSGKPEYLHGPSFAFDSFVGIQLHERVAIGAHAGYAAVATGGGDSIPSSSWKNRRSLFDIGPALQLYAGRWYFEGWLGYHLTAEQTTTTVWPDEPGTGPAMVYTSRHDLESIPAYGIVVGRDFGTARCRPAVYLEVQWARAERPADDYTALTLGAALRY